MKLKIAWAFQKLHFQGVGGGPATDGGKDGWTTSQRDGWTTSQRETMSHPLQQQGANKMDDTKRLDPHPEIAFPSLVYQVSHEKFFECKTTKFGIFLVVISRFQ